MGPTIVDTYYSKVSGASFDNNQGGYTFPCSASLPSISISIGNDYVTIPGKYINLAPTDSSGVTCFGGLQSVGDPSQGIPYIYGDIYFKSAFTIFDYNNGSPRLGWAKKPAGTP